MTVRINKQKINLREKLTEFEDKVNFDEVVRGLGENTSPLILNKDGGNVGIGATQPITTTHIKGDALTIEEPGPIVGRKIQVLPPESGVDATIRNNTTGAGFQFQNNPSADGETFVDLVKIDGAGNVGIGTASPVSILHVNKSVNTTNTGLTISNYDNTVGTNQQIRLDFGLARNSGALKPYAGRILVGKEQDWTIADADINAFMSFGLYEENVLGEKMRITSDGSILIGKTTTTQNTAGTQISATTGARITVDGNVSAILNRLTSDGSIASFRREGDEKGSISINGNTTAYNTSSDYRLKTDVQAMTGAIERLKALKPVNFEWISDGTRVDGFLAHEAQEIVPEAVTGTKDAMQTEQYEVTPAVYEDVIIPATDEVVDEDGNVITEAQEERTEQELVSEAVMGEREVPEYQGIDQSKLVPLLTAAIQEQQSIIEDLKSRIETLESK